MHKLKTLLEIQLIKEALPLHVAKSYVTMGGRRGENPHIEAQMNSVLDFIKQQPNVKVSKRGDRVAVPYNVEYVISDSNPSPELIKFYNALDVEREQANHQIINKLNSKHKNTFPGYSNVFALAMPTIKDQYGRDIKMSKYITSVLTTAYAPILDAVEGKLKPDPDTGKLVLTQNDGTKLSADEARAKFRNIIKTEIEKLIKQYNEIPEVKDLRPNKTKKYYIVFSKHPYDIAGMSTDRGWSSCMNLYSGSNARYIQYDVRMGTMVAYLVKEDDLNIKNPTARIAIKPFINYENPSDVLYEPESRTYGTAHAEFWQQVNKLVSEAQPGKTGTFELVDTLYCDSKRYRTKYGDPDMTNRINQMFLKKQPATTVDEIKYILTQYYSYVPEDIKGVKFHDRDKVYADLSGFTVIVPPEFNYNPVPISNCHLFGITNPTTLESFPEHVNDLRLYNYNKSDFTGLTTTIHDRLTISGCELTNFNGIMPGCRFVELQHIPGRGSSIVKSFSGLPSTVNYIEAPLNITNNTSIVLDMTLEDMIRDLKALGLTNLQLYIDVDYLDKLLLANAQSSFAGKFMDSLYAKMKSIPIYEAEYGGRKGSQYYRLLGWISRELPTLQYWTHYQSGASDLRRLPQWAFPENW